MDISLVLEKLNTSNIVEDAILIDDCYLYLKVPFKYAQIPYFPDINGLNKLDINHIYMFFDNILSKYMSIFAINGNILDKNNGAIYLDGFTICTNCKRSIVFPRYVKAQIHYCEVCVCVYPHLINNTFKCILGEENIPNLKNFKYGSLLDWVPIYQDMFQNFILYNANPASEKYSYFSFAYFTKNHKIVFQSISERNIDVLREILQKKFINWNKTHEKSKKYSSRNTFPLLTYLQDKRYKCFN